MKNKLAKMNADQIRIPGSRWRFIIVMTLTSYAGIIFIHLLVIHKPIADCLPALIGIAMATLLAIKSPILRKYDIVISSDYVEGPIRSGLLSRRHAVPLHHIDISGSKTPSLTRNGYIRTQNNQRIFLLALYFSPSQGNAIFEEIERRLSSQSTLR
ncbi:MAG: hypothetical protein ABSG44_00115 [Thermodesulfobacteriota bacterium]|jgi:hypothetical protein